MVFQNMALLVFLLNFLPKVCGELSSFTFPTSFEGFWAGRFEFAMLGPMSHFTAFSISKAPNGDYLMEQNIAYDDHELMGYQRFYVEGSGETAGELWYCGRLTNFSDGVENAGQVRLDGFKAQFTTISATSVTFCLDDNISKGLGNPFQKDCSGCDCGNWTLQYDPTDDTLHSQVSMSGAEGHTHSKHMWTTFKRIGPAPMITDADTAPHGSDFACDFSDGGRDAGPVKRGGGCPFLMKSVDKSGKSGPTEAQKILVELGSQEKPPTRTGPSTTVIASSSGKYEHCYNINQATGKTRCLLLRVITMVPPNDDLAQVSELNGHWTRKTDC